MTYGLPVMLTGILFLVLDVLFAILIGNLKKDPRLAPAEWTYIVVAIGFILSVGCILLGGATWILDLIWRPYLLG